LAKDLGMSVSGFHAHFKAVTAIRPIGATPVRRLTSSLR
jgi:hypothetical protein